MSSSRKKSILLLVPPTDYRRPYPKLSPLYMGSILRERGYVVTCLDGQLADLDLPHFLKLYPNRHFPRSTYAPVNWDTYQHFFKEHSFDVLITSPTTGEVKSSARCAAIAKAEQDLLTIATNNHVSALPKASLEEFESFDLVFKGEPEQALPDFLDAYFSSSSHWQHFPGIAFRHNGKIVENEGSHSVDPQTLPYPARDLVPIPSYNAFFRTTRAFGDAHPAGLLRTSRGCPSRCTFCTVPTFKGIQFRAQNPDYVVNELAYLTQKYQVRCFHFLDDVFNVDRERVRAICRKILERGLDIRFYCWNKVNFVDFTTLQLMAKAGCQSIFYGVESGSPQVLASVQKGITLEQVREAVTMTKKAGVPTAAIAFIVGNLEDTEETLEESIAFSLQLIDCGAAYAQFLLNIPLPGTPDFQKIEPLLLTRDWDMFNAVLLYELHPTPLFKHPHLTFEQMLFYQKKGYELFEKKLAAKKLLSGRLFLDWAGALRKRRMWRWLPAAS